jgi:eukaryotic-like serine/threonine-protein kinase
MSTRLIEQAEPIPGYRLVERLGRGGFGEVWKVIAPGGVFKAIKIVHGDMENVGADCRAAEQELKALDRVKTIRHPYILSIDRFDIVNGQLMIVMEMADRSLSERLDQCRSQGLPGIPRDELLRYMDETAEALDLMNFHHQIQHLDIKPQNLLLIHNHVKVADFGLAKDFEGLRCAVTGGVTPIYAAPETSEGWVSRYCDQYSLAIVYQELLTGLRPFSGINPAQVLIQHLTAPPNVAPLPIHDRDIVAKALSKKPNDRFASCTEFVQALRNSATASIATAQPLNVAATIIPDSVHDSESRSEPITTQPNKAPGGAIRSTTSAQLSTAPDAAANQTRVPTPIPTSETLPSRANQSRSQAVPVRVLEQESSQGVLFPTYVVAAGKLGLRVLQCLRSHLYKRFNHGTFSHWRWLFIDTDEATLDSSVSGSKRYALTANEVYRASMDRPLQYLKRDGLPPPTAWMGNDMLYRIPRQPATAGVRSLGRLALLDHASDLCQRISQDLLALQNDAVLEESSRSSQLGIRFRTPRVYLAASLAGGTGSGMLIDLAYLIRNEMDQAGLGCPHLTGLLLAPAIENRAGGILSIANSFATLAELHHWSLNTNHYEVHFDTRQPSRTIAHRPFDRCVLFALPKDAIVELPSAAEQAANLIVQETLTPMGRSADAARRNSPAGANANGLSLQSCGSNRLVWPRRTLLDVTSYRFAAKAIKDWVFNDGLRAREEINALIEAKWHEAGFAPESLSARFHAHATRELGATPEAAIEEALKALPPPRSRLDPESFAAAIDRITTLVGKAGPDEEKAPGGIASHFKTAMDSLIQEASFVVSQMSAHFVEQSECRIAAAEGVIRLFNERLQNQINDYDDESVRLRRELDEVHLRVLAALELVAPPASRRGSQTTPDVRSLLRDWSRKRVHFLTSRYVIALYRQMLSLAPDCLRDADYCRQLLLDWATRLDREAEIVAEPTTTNEKFILPPGCSTLLEAADLLIKQAAGDHALDFRSALRGGDDNMSQSLIAIGRTMKEQGLRIVKALVSQASSIVKPRLGDNSPAAELLRNQTDERTLRQELLQAFERSKPDDFGQAAAADAQSFIFGITADEPGGQLTALVKNLLPEREVIDTDAANEIVFYREYHALSLPDLPQVGPAAMQAVYDVRSKQRINPFSRIDVNWTSFLRE